MQQKDKIGFDQWTTKDSIPLPHCLDIKPRVNMAMIVKLLCAELKKNYRKGQYQDDKRVVNSSEPRRLIESSHCCTV